jgi:hypothetical protein
MRAATSLGNAQGVSCTDDVRSASVPPDIHVEGHDPHGGATLGDFLAPQGKCPSQSRSPELPPLTACVEEEQTPSPFFMSKRDQLNLRDLPAPDLKRTPGRTGPIIGTFERKPYAFENPQAHKFNFLDLSTADKVTRRSTTGGALPFGMAGREPEQPPPISKDDPLVKAAKRVQDEITERICPQYRAHLWKLRALKQRGVKDREANSQQASGQEPTSSGASPTSGPRKRQPRPKKPLYRLNHGGGRVEMDLDVLFSGQRFKDLLALHDFMIDRELHGNTNDGHHGTQQAEPSWGDDDAVTSDASKSPLSIAERMEQGLPVTFDEAVAEAERREGLLRLRCLSLSKDGTSHGQSSAWNQKRGTVSFVSGPDRFSTADKSELHDKAFGGLQQLKGEQHSPATAMFRSHMKLKQLYETLHSDNTDVANSSMRKLSVHR